jgi:IclR family transcriptional regulator, KDG regulon repressor
MSGVQSVARSMAVLERLALSGGAGVQELARDLGLAPSTVQRLVGALVEVGLVEQVPLDRSYRVTLRLFQWGQAPLRRLGLREVAKPFLQELSAEAGETIALGVLDDAHVMHVEWIPARHLVQPRVGIGERIPAHTSSLGRCLLAWQPEPRRGELTWASVKADGRGSDPGALEAALAEVRERGYALVADSPPNICTVAAPVWDAHQVVVGAIGVGGPSTRFGPEQARALAPRLMEIGSAISTHVGSTQPALHHEGSA